MKEFTVVEWTDRSVPMLLDLARTSHGAGGAAAQSEAFWQWKHQDNPFGRSYGIVALDESAGGDCRRVASVRMLLRWRFRTSAGETVRAARAVDTATRPGYRRRGLFARLTQQAIADLTADGTHLIYNTPNAYSLPGYLKLGWRAVESRPIYLRPLRPLRMALRRIRPMAPASGALQGFFDSAVMLPWNEFVERHAVQAFELAEAWEQRRRRAGLRTVRSQAYYSWRYGRHPHATYWVCPVWMPGQANSILAGFAVLRPNIRSGWQEAVLCEIALAEPARELGRRLARRLIAYTRADYIAAHFARGTVELECLRQAGFFRLPNRGMTFAVRPLAELPVNPAAPEAWDMTLGDLEVF